MIHASRPLAASAIVLAASAVAATILLIPGLRPFFAFFYWIHVAIIALGIWAMWRSRKLRTTWLEALRIFWSTLPRWVLALSNPVLLLLLPAATSGAFSLGALPDGTPVHRRSWYESDGKFWVRENNLPPRELASAEFEVLQLQHSQVFASAWVLFSYLILLQWHYVGRREGQAQHAA
jgi:ABC-type dipeptide/oligopeptide/nickel transport system permease component